MHANIEKDFPMSIYTVKVNMFTGEKLETRKNNNMTDNTITQQNSLRSYCEPYSCRSQRKSSSELQSNDWLNKMGKREERRGHSEGQG